jgi:hypothetical protein
MPFHEIYNAIFRLLHFCMYVSMCYICVYSICIYMICRVYNLLDWWSDSDSMPASRWLYVYVYVCEYVYVYVYVYVYAYVCMYIYTHTYPFRCLASFEVAASWLRAARVAFAASLWPFADQMITNSDSDSYSDSDSDLCQIHAVLADHTHTQTQDQDQDQSLFAFIMRPAGSSKDAGRSERPVTG